MRAALVALSVAVLAAAAVLATLDRGDSQAVPGWVARALAGLEIRSADVQGLPVTRGFAVRAVERAVFLDDAPEREPFVVQLLVGGRFARSPVPLSPSGDVVVPEQQDVPAWAVAWQGLGGERLERLGDWPDGTRVDAVFLVDGITGDCCFVTRFVPKS